MNAIPHILRSLFGDITASVASGWQRVQSSLAPQPRELPWRPEVLSREALGDLAVALAEQHRNTFGVLRSHALLRHYAVNRQVLRRVYMSLAEASHQGESLTAGAEWLLDNYHVVERHAAAIKKFLPYGFYKTLPKFMIGDLRGFPRVYHLALEFIIHTDAVVDPQIAAHFVRSYQQRLELSSGELWAFPIMLRFALFENLRRLMREAEKELIARRDVFSLVDQILGDEARTGTEIMVELARRLAERESFLPHGAIELLKRLRGRGRKAYMALQFLEETLRERNLDPEDLLRSEDHNQAARQISVGNTLTSLTAIDQMNWREWFESVSLAEAVLRRDPARLYPAGDFITRDQLRHEIEKLALSTTKTDSEIAQGVLSCAESARPSPDLPEEEALRQRYVGYFLTAEGRATLERAIGYTPSPFRRVQRWLRQHALPVYLGAIAAITLLLLLYVTALSSWAEASQGIWLLTLAITFLPASELASSLVQYLVSRWVTPKPLPKLSFDNGIPADHKTLVVVHTIFSGTGSIQRAIDGLEVRFLANDDEVFTYALMADLPDAPTEHTDNDAAIIARAQNAIETLNARHASPEHPRFMLFFRRRLWNEREGVWMAWERKRGKIEELNRYLLGDTNTTLQLVVGRSELVRGIRYVLTLDSDSQLPRDAGKKLVATIAHPMNRPVIDDSVRRVVRGYAFIQPRVSISLTSATQSPFSQLFSGQAGLDPYTNVISEVYQDLFAEGSFWGKGIYDLHAFEHVLRDRVPENALLSHDLFEGSFARVALASDIELFDDFPSRYMGYSKRLHRWVRGDWQLLPWLFPFVPSASGRERNQLSWLSLWKMVDNLRRSLLPLACLIALIGGWVFLPGGPLAWSVLVLLVVAFPVFTGLAGVFTLPSRGISIGGFLGDIGRDVYRNSLRAVFGIAFLPHQAAMMLNAITITLYRLFISRKHLLEWEPAERSEQRSKNEMRGYYRLFVPTLALIGVASVIGGVVHPTSLFFSLPLFVVWLLSPEVAKRVSEPYQLDVASISPSEQRYLRAVAFDTWRFFDDYLREEYHYLMPDNLQMIPNEVVAERTSPTNLSLSLLGIFSANDLGFLPFHASVQRAALTMASIMGLERYRGHLFNWYSIRTREPLHPRYISTVDSGNMLGHLYTLLSILEGAESAPLVHQGHVVSMLSFLDEALALSAGSADPAWNDVRTIHRALSSYTALSSLTWLNEFVRQSETLTAIQDLALRSPEEVASHLLRFSHVARELLGCRELIGWCERLISCLREPSFSQMDRTLSMRVTQAVSRVEQSPTLVTITQSVVEIEEALGTLSAESAATEGAALEQAALSRALSEAKAAADMVRMRIRTMQRDISLLIEGMDFSFLYDEQRALFTIGFNSEHARKDQSFYDLLASEARLLSFLAVARGEVPQKHWFALGRSLANTSGGKALVSWSGTMFEYLMPFIVMHDYPTTLLGRTGRAVVRAQIRYGEKQSVPWGISESAYSGVDYEKTYQYRAFGVPGLGLKRGLSEDLVVSPYSTFLALPFLASLDEGVENLHALEDEGARGKYGFYEAIDYTPSRHVRSAGKHIVQSFFAHHQGMSLTTVNNVLNGDIMCRRFHNQPVIRSAELLLHEKFPARVAAIVPHEPELQAGQREEEVREEPGLEIIRSPHTAAPCSRIVSNGRYSVLVDAAGNGFSKFERAINLTRWREDPTATSSGSFFYIRDKGSGKVWSAAYQPSKREADSYEAIFSPGRIEFKRFDDKVFLHTEITVAPEDDVELRRMTVTNLGDTVRELEIISYLEPVMSPGRADAAHPAFSKLFVRTEHFPETDAILCSRRPRTEHEEELFFFHRVTLKTSYAKVLPCLSRTAFIGRGRTLENPLYVSEPGARGMATAPDVDPIASLTCQVVLEPGASETLVFVSGAGRSREAAERLIERYQELMHVNRAFELSWSRAQVELRNHAYSAAQWDLFNRLAGCLMHNEESVRGNPDALMGNRLTQSALWRFGISGDLPIVLVKVTESRQTRIVQEILLAHHFLRERCVDFDFVILHKSDGSYMQHLAEDLEYVVRLSPSGYMLDRPGGVFLRSTGQISEGEVNLLETVARVVVDAEVKDLSETLKSPAFESVVAPPPRTLQKRGRTEPPLPPALIQENALGGFSRDGKSYFLSRIGRYATPLPWSNVVANPNFGFLTTESGGGYTWSENSRENRLSAWSNDPVLDTPSEVVFVRRADSGEYWSLTPLPAAEGLEFTVEHGFGFSTFSTSNGGLGSQLTVHGALSDGVKWSSVTLTNGDTTEQRLELFLYCDIVLGVVRDDSYRFVTTHFDRTAQALYAQNFYNNEFAGRAVYVGSSEAIVGYTGSRLEFVGRNGSLEHPAALERGAVHPFFLTKPKAVKLSGRVGGGIDPCLALHITVTLKPRESKTVHFYLAESPTSDIMRRDAVRYRSLQTEGTELRQVKGWWDELLSTVHVDTPSESFNVMMNGWLLYQTVACRLFGRSGFYQSGGAFGFRDQLQDSLALLAVRPEMVRSQILLHAAHQFSEGDVQHWWHPPTGRGVRTRITDDLLWLPYAVSRYIETTDDYSILGERVPFLHGAPLAEGQMETYFIPDRNGESGTILEHCLRTFGITAAVGEHHLPLMGAGDWNDGMNEVGRHGRGESVWLAWFQVEVIKRFAPILEAHGEPEKAHELRARAAALKDAAETHAWDGEWYRRAFYDDGTPIGSRESDECTIDSLAQSWGIISGAAEQGRAAQSMESVYQRLVNPEGRIVKLLTPPFNTTQKNPGYIKGYPPGIRENGGQYTHAAAWVVIAATLLRQGNKATELFELINPINATRDPRGLARYMAEPYVLCGDVYSEGALTGRAGWSWYTGSAGWLFQAGFEHILGIQVRANSLTVDPVLSSSWPRATVTYKRERRTFRITIENTAKVQSGVTIMTIDGREAPARVVPFEDPSYGDVVEVRVVMG